MATYTTVSIKDQWRTVFRCGNTVDPQDVILILGSCRVVPYLNYLDHANERFGNRFKIYAVDPINYCVDTAGNMLDQRRLLKELETDEHFLSILKETSIFLHEGLANYGILNTVRPKPGDTWESPVWIYDFIKPRIDVSCPNFHDVFLLFEDFKKFPPYKDRQLTAEDEREIYEAGEKHIERFCGICEKSSFPEFAQWFVDNYLERRLFHSFNHVSSAFTMEIFRRANEQFLHLSLDDAFWAHVGATDLYANNSTPVTEQDRRWRAWKFA